MPPNGQSNAFQVEWWQYKDNNDLTAARQKSLRHGDGVAQGDRGQENGDLSRVDEGDAPDHDVGCPVVPAGFSSQGLPIGIQIVDHTYGARLGDGVARTLARRHRPALHHVVWVNRSQSLDHPAGLFPASFDQGGPSAADRPQVENGALAWLGRTCHPHGTA
jgi:hypothetical protein